MIALRLYIAGDDAVSQTAVQNFERLLADCGDVDSEVIDIFERPEIARELRILATPVLVRCVPEPRRKVIGDLSDIQRVMTVLGLRPADACGGND